MKRVAVLVCGIILAWGYLHAAELEYFKVHKPQQGMSADEIMRIKYFNKYTLFAHDIEFNGSCYFIDKSGSTRTRKYNRKRLNLGRESDGIAYKEFVVFTAPTTVKGLCNLSWSYLNPQRDQDVWLWLPSLRKIRKVSASQSDDSFLGSDFTVEDATTRRFEDETYTLVKEEDFPGYTSDFDEETYYKDTPCYVIEAKPNRPNWYYTKRLLWIDKQYGVNIFEEKYDAAGQKFQTIFRTYKIHQVDGKEYPVEKFLEAKDIRSGHRTEIINEDVKIDRGMSENEFTENMLSRSRW